MKRSKQCTLFEFDVFAKTKEFSYGKTRIPSSFIWMSKLSNVAISDEIRVGNRYVWQGGQTENQGGQTWPETLAAGARACYRRENRA